MIRHRWRRMHSFLAGVCKVVEEAPLGLAQRAQLVVDVQSQAIVPPTAPAANTARSGARRIRTSVIQPALLFR